MPDSTPKRVLFTFGVFVCVCVYMGEKLGTRYQKWGGKNYNYLVVVNYYRVNKFDVKHGIFSTIRE